MKDQYTPKISTRTNYRNDENAIRFVIIYQLYNIENIRGKNTVDILAFVAVNDHLDHFQ